MNRFVGRKKELMFLEKEYKKPGSSFIVIYGRRRVGKTTLIKEFIKNKDSLYFLATEELEQANMKRLANSVSRYTGQPYLSNARFDKWDSIFEIIEKHKTDYKKIVVLDEFQYLLNSNKAFSSIFQRIWDEKLSTQNIMVIICGSLISMMVSEVLSYSSPLYGRRTGQIKLAPLNFNEFTLFFRNKSFKQLLNIYSVTGGVPKYIEIFDTNNDIINDIENNILNKESYLYEEPVFLLEKEIKELVSYFSILKVIAMGNHKIGKISSVLEIPNTKITPYLKTLIDLEIIEKKIPITEKMPEKSRKGLYFIKDMFINFWFKFVFPYKSELEIENTQYVVDKLNKNFIDNHVALIYEQVCRQTLWNKNVGCELPLRFNKIGSYWDGNMEIDIAAMDNENVNFLFGECKYWNRPVDEKVFYQLEKKVVDSSKLTKMNKIFYIIFSESGFSPSLKQLEESREDLTLLSNSIE